MYEELEAWNAKMAKTIDWIEENKLQNKIVKEFKLPISDNSSKLTPLEYEWLLDELCTKEMGSKEFDKELDKLAKRL